MAPTRFGRYEVRRVLGRGGMGVVYEGHDPQIDRPVAIKTIALDALNAEEATQFEARFRAEMRSTGRLLHQNIVALYDAGRDEGTAYIVMELVPGQDLKRRLAAGERFDAARVLDIGRQLLAALDDAHARQVVHRDVKPANVMLQDDGQVKLCDFGVARLTDGDATRTLGGVVGTLRYASPEQIDGGVVDARSDLYSAAALLRELLGSDVPPAVDAVLQRAMSHDPARRFDNAAASAPTAQAEPPSRLPAAAPKPPKLDGSWSGLYSCGETIGPRASGVSGEPFSAQLAVEVQGPRISWTRGSKTYVEWAAGSIDARGRFSAEGEGKEDTGTRKSHWRLRASGGYNTKVQPPRLDGDVELLRPKDGSLARRCTFSAVKR